MDPLFGSAWQGKTETKIYQHRTKVKQQHERPTDHHAQFQNALHNHFTMSQQSITEEGHRLFRFPILNKKKIEVQVCLFFYNYKSMGGKLISRNPRLSYRLSSIYKLPLSQLQLTSFVFHRLFNLLQAENLFISIQFLQKEGRLVIQFSRYESDIINMSQGVPRLTGTYWKPTLVDKAESMLQSELSLIVFLQKIIDEVQNIDQPGCLVFRQQSRLSFLLFKLFNKPLSFVGEDAAGDPSFNLHDYLSAKQAVSFRTSQGCPDMEAQYIQAQRQKTDSNFTVIIYVYNYRNGKVFGSNDLLFGYKQFTILKKPVSQKQFTNAFFKQTILVVSAARFFISFQVEATRRTVLIQISQNNEDILNKIRGRNRFDSQYWKFSEESRRQSRQEKVDSLQNTISVIGGYLNETSILGSWKASNNIITRLAAYLA